MIPQISGAMPIEQIRTVAYPSHTYRFTENEIVGNVDGIEAIQQAVYHILSTERYAYAIYDDNYGVELEKYIGKSFGYLEATIETALRDALLQDDRITSVTVTKVEKTGADSALAEFTVTCNRGTFAAEVQVNV